MGQAQDIYILAETDGERGPTALSLELLGLGRRLASHIGTGLSAIVPGSGISAAAREIAEYGTDEVFLLDDPAMASYHPETYSQALAGFLRGRGPLALLAAHNSMGQDLLPRLAFSLGCGLVMDCVGLEVQGGSIIFSRPVYGGNAMATQKANTASVMATVRARVGEAPQRSGAAGKVSPVCVETPTPSRLVLKGREAVVAGECPLEEAAVVVSGGRGMGGVEGFQRLWELASIFGGAVGASRPPVDSGWAPTTCQVGITGKVVAPDIYVAVAISGSTQHLSGMGEAGKIVAINKDPDAFIFKVSDYGVVGEWQQVLPAFTAALKELLEG